MALSMYSNNASSNTKWFHSDWMIKRLREREMPELVRTVNTLLQCQLFTWTIHGFFSILLFLNSNNIIGKRYKMTTSIPELWTNGVSDNLYFNFTTDLWVSFFCLAIGRRPTQPTPPLIPPTAATASCRRKRKRRRQRHRGWSEGSASNAEITEHLLNRNGATDPADQRKNPDRTRQPLKPQTSLLRP